MEFLFLIAVYFFPAVLAEMRSHHSRGAIFVLNFLLGWTFLGWIIALVWACTGARSYKAPAIHSGDKDVADEIRKLADLRRDGFLTDEEFNKRKGFILRVSK